MSNRKVQNTPAAIRREFAAIPQDTLCVMGVVVCMVREGSSSSATTWGMTWYCPTPPRPRRLPHPRKRLTRSTRTSWPTCSGGGYIAESHVPGKEVIAARQLVRYRHDKVQQRDAVQERHTRHTAARGSHHTWRHILQRIHAGTAQDGRL